MARFSIGRDDDLDGSSSPDPKRQRTTTTTPTPTPTAATRPVPPPTQTPRIPNRDGEQLCQQPESEEDEEDEEEEEEEDLELDVEEEEEVGVEEEDDDEEEEEDVEEEEEEVEICDGGQRGKGIVNEERSESSQSARPGGEGGVSVLLSDPDVLDCPICLEPLTVPVFQCENGHVACNCCCSKLKNRCPSCCWPIGYNRCRAIEKVIESIKISCPNMKYGCKEAVSYCKKHDHEHACLHAPASCPIAGCRLVCSSKKLYQHFSIKHSNLATHFSYNKVFTVSLTRGSRHAVLQEKIEGVIFILNFAREDFGTLVNVNCIGPTTTKKGYSYELTAKNGETSVVLQSVTENWPSWVEHNPKKAFLVVPREYEIPIRGAPAVLLKLEVCIRRPSGNPAGI